MSPYKTTDSTPPTPKYCTPDRLLLLLEAGIETDGHIDHLRSIIARNGYNQPSQENEHWGFVFRQKFTRLYIAEADACAEEILMLLKYKMIKK